MVNAIDDPPESKDVVESKHKTISGDLSAHGRAAIQGNQNLEIQQIEIPKDSPTTQVEKVSDPNDNLLMRPSYFEAREGDRNVEDDIVEGNYDLHPSGKGSEEDQEMKPGGLKWTPLSHLEKGG
jgi:hypothetical protein